MRLALALAVIFIALPASAQNLEWQDFDISVGGAAQYRPDYLGSDDYEFGFVPDAEIAWQKTLFVSTSNGAGVYIVDYPKSRFGVSVSPDFGRDEDENSQLAGMGDIDFGWRLNVFGNLYYEPFIAGAKASIALAEGAEGHTVNAYVGLRKPLTDRITGQMLLGTTWAGASWGNAYYGVDAAQSVSSGYAQYRVDSGFRDVALGGSLSYSLTPEVSLTSSARWTHLLGDVADSPLVTEEDNLTVSLGLNYRLATATTGAGH